MKSSFSFLLLLLLLLHYLSSSVSAAIVCSAAHDLMVTGSFVDIYDVSVNAPTVLATSDGGAVVAFRRLDSGHPRVVKVDSAAQFEWFSEQLVVGAAAGVYYPRAIVEGTAGADTTVYLYVAGHALYGTVMKAFVIKYRRWDGGYINSAVLMKDTYSSYIYDLFLDPSGTMLFGGSYNNLGIFYAWGGTIDTSTLVGTEVTAPFSASVGRVRRIIEDTDGVGYYVFVGAKTASNLLWVVRAFKSSLTIDWEYADAVYTVLETPSFIKVGIGKYAILSASNYYEVTSAGVSVPVVLADSTAMTISSQTNMVTIVGYSIGLLKSFAYHYDYTTSTSYTAGENAEYDLLHLYFASGHPSFTSVWASGHIFTSATSAYTMAIVKIECVTPLVCGAATNYFNQACYPVLSSGCFGLCGTCLLTGNSSACASDYAPLTISLAINLFAGRCTATGKFYQASSASCIAVTQPTSCHELCGGECFVSSNNAQCAHHCKGERLEPNIDISGLGINTCACKAGTSLSGMSKRCAATTGCYGLCSECGVPGDNTKCIGCISGAHIIATTIEAYTTCACASGYALSGNVCLACSEYCNGCTVPGDNTKCSACAAITSITQTGAAAPYTCACASGSVLSGNSCLPCHSFCGECSAPGNGSKCITCSSSIANVVKKSGSPSSYTCGCASNSLLAAGPSCVLCYPLCGACTSPADSTKCLVCASIPNVLQVSGPSPTEHTCQCSDSTSFDSASGLCIFTTGCHPLCAGKCVLQYNSQACLACSSPEVTVAIATAIVGVYDCTCQSGTTFNGLGCTRFLQSGCYPLCGSGCLETNNPLRCVDCRGLINSMATVVNDYYFNCSCAAGTELVGTVCAYTSGCHPNCESCFVQNNASACVSCKAGITPILTNFSGISYATCSCLKDTVYSNGTCVAIYNTAASASCHFLCGKGCTVPNDRTKCVATCRDSKNIVIEHTFGEVITCGCASGTYLNGDFGCVLNVKCDSLCADCLDSATCSQCPKGEGMVLSEGKCICAVSEGYVFATDQTGTSMCIDTGKSAADALQTTGTTFTIMVVVVSSLFPGSGGSFWKYFSLAQELLLASVISTQFISEDLVAMFKGCDFVNFGIFDYLISLFPPEYQGEADYNVLTDIPQYYPSLTGKMFLANSSQQISFTLLSVLAFAGCLGLGFFFAYFQKLAQSYLYGGVIGSIQSSFIDITLFAFIQLKNFTLGYGALYSVCCFAACFALAIEIAVVAFSLNLLRKPTCLLVEPAYKDKYGALYEDLKELKPALLTTIIHNIRVFALILFLVLLAPRGLAQAIVFTLFSVAGFAWSIAIRPYDGTLVNIQVFTFDAAKIASGLGYIILEASSTSADTAQSILAYETVVFLLAICIGLVITVTQQAIALFNKVKEWYQRSDLEKVRPSSASSENSARSGMSARERCNEFSNN